MKFLAIFLVAFNLMVAAQTLEVASDEPKLLTLYLGGSVTGIDGVVVEAVYAELKEPIELMIERIDNPEMLPPFSYSLPVAITNYYKITSPERHFIHPGDLGVHIPHPEGAPTEILSVGFLRSNNSDYDKSQWALLPATYAPSTDEILFSLKQVDPTGVIVVIVKGGYYIPELGVEKP
jgi:hypothetical protein